MQNQTRDKFEQYLAAQASINELPLPRVAQQFTVSPTVAQKLEQKIQASSDFLRKINVLSVAEQEGQKVGIGVSAPAASRNSSSTTRREPRSLDKLSNEGKYRCEQTNCDTFLSYARLDAWASQPNFKNLVSGQMIQRRALDRIMIGFNGKAAAAKSDFTANALLQDINIGWLQHYRTHASQRVMSDVTISARDENNKLLAKGKYSNLDALAFDAVSSLIEPWYQDSTDLVVICGRKLLTDKYFPIVNTFAPNNPNSEVLASQILLSQQQIGGMPTYRVPFFPSDALLITSFANLSIYVQANTHRRAIKDEPEYSRVATYESANEAYVVEDYGFGCLIDGIKPAQAAAAPAAQGGQG